MPETTCSIKNCEGEAGARGWCHNHYERWRRHGRRDPGRDLRSRPTIERFHERVALAPAWACWLWQGALKENGYGRIRHNGREMYVHRFAYEAFVGPIPKGHEVDHICEVCNCVNPNHLQTLPPLVHRRVVRRSTCLSGRHPREAPGERCRGCAREGAAERRGMDRREWRDLRSEILTVIRHEGLVSASDIGLAVGLEPVVVGGYLRGLKNDGLVEKVHAEARPHLWGPL